MTEVLFVLTIIFVAYVVYVIVNEQKQVLMAAELKAKTKLKTEEAVAANKSAPVATEPPARKVVNKTEPVAVAKTTITPKPVNATKGNVRNPATGEIASVLNNYRFTKRWIKEALVTEGFLEKIYKNNELNADSEAAIKAAMTKLETLDKYRAS